jgi:hypothetical protein
VRWLKNLGNLRKKNLFPKRLTLTGKCTHRRTNSSLGSKTKAWRKYTEEEKNLIRELYPQQRFCELKKLLVPNHSWDSVTSAAQYYGWSNNGPIRLYTVNKNYFSVPKPQNCYWAGFIAADGYLPRYGSSRREYNDRLRLNLQEQDGHHLELFRKHVGFTGSVKYSANGGAAKGFNYARLEICDVRQWVDDLRINFNITYDKSQCLPPPNIKDATLLKCYFAGLIDGDGSILLITRKCKYGCGKQTVLMLNFNGLESILRFVKGRLDEWYPCEKPSNLSLGRRCRTHDSYRYQVAGTRAFSILKDISQHNIPLLERKWGKII